jgi:hypothetical protein
MYMQTKKGFSLIETIIYISGLVIIVLAVSGLTVKILSLYKDLVIIPRTDQAAIAVIDKIVKDVRSGVSVDTNNSLLDTGLGSLALNSQEDGVIFTKKFGYENGRIYYQENGGGMSTDYITPDDFEVTEIRFTRIYTGISEAIRVDLDFTYQNRGVPVTKEYTGLSILRKSYE